MNLIQKNIDNLTSLWRRVGEPEQAHTTRDDFEFSAINYSEWPNRLWFHEDVNENSLRAAKDQLLSSSTKLVVPYWDIYQSRSYELLEANGFEKLSEQVGMSLKLDQSYEATKSLRLEKVTDKKSAILWEKLFFQAFNYRISHKLLLSSLEDIEYLIAYHKNETVGTGIFYDNGNGAMGIHSMGIIPEMRRKGFAEQMMLSMLSQSSNRGFNYATLQASDLGKGLYLKLGFEEQFIMKNYVLQQHV